MATLLNRCCNCCPPDLRDRYTNNTAIAGVAPQERFTDTHTSTGCDQNDNCPGTQCGSWIGPASDEYTLLTAPQSFIHAPGNQLDFANCHKRGFKAIKARRQWHGRLGFLQTGDNRVCLYLTTDLHGDPIYNYKTWRDYDAAPPQTKYLTLDITIEDKLVPDASATACPPASPSAWDARDNTWHNNISVDAHSGETVLNACSLFNGSTITSSAPNVQLFNDLGEIMAFFKPPGIDNISSAPMTVTATATYFKLVDPATGNTVSEHTCDPSTGTFLINNYGIIADDCLGDDPSAASHWGILDSFALSLTDTGYTYTYTQNGEAGPDPKYTETVTVTVALSDANTASSVQGDLQDNLLSTWPLNDDALHPWRTDSLVHITPLVSRNELTAIAPQVGLIPCTMDDINSPVIDANGNAPYTDISDPPRTGWTYAPGNNDCYGNPPGSPDYAGGPCPWQPTFAQIAWKDPAVWQWSIPAINAANGPISTATLVQMVDGSILGAPNPAGYDDYFQYNFEDIRGCCNVDPGSGLQSYNLYQYGTGMWLGEFNARTGAQIPLNATQWTNLREAVAHTPAAFLSYADPALVPSPGEIPACPLTGHDGNPSPNGDGSLWGCKMAWLLSTFQSANFARPGGNDKFACLEDDSDTFCYDSDTLTAGAGTITVLARDGSTPGSLPFSAGDLVGGKGVNGFYTVSSVSGNVITVSAQKYNLPGNWASRSGDDLVIFGKLINPTAPSLLGRAAVTAITDGTHAPFTTGWTPTYQFAAAQPNFGMDVTTTPANSEQIDLYTAAGMTSFAANVTATRVSDTIFTLPTAYAVDYVMIHGAPDFSLNTQAPKGDFAWVEWLCDFRNNSTGEPNRLGFGSATDCAGTALLPATVTYANSDCNDTSLTLALPTNGYQQFCQHPGNLPFLTCQPRVFAVTPNGETWANGTVQPFPSFALDQLYGSKWICQIVESMDDPFWQRPHKPCSATGHDPDTDEDVTATGTDVIWVEDDGTCRANSGTGSSVTAYFAMAPQVETLLSIPAGGTLPAGLTLGFLSPVNHTLGSAQPPPPSGYLDDFSPLPAHTPYGLIDTLCTSLAGSCRFAGDYSTWAICPL